MSKKSKPAKIVFTKRMKLEGSVLRSKEVVYNRMKGGEVSPRPKFCRLKKHHQKISRSRNKPKQQGIENIPLHVSLKESIQVQREDKDNGMMMSDRERDEKYHPRFLQKFRRMKNEKD